jgi:hypothetical protein
MASAVLYGCETLPLTLKREHHRVLKTVFGCKGAEVTGGWGKLHNEELQNLHSLPNINMIKSGRCDGLGM